MADFELRFSIQKKHTGKVRPFIWDPRPGTRDSSPGTRDPGSGTFTWDPGPGTLPETFTPLYYMPYERLHGEEQF